MRAGVNTVIRLHHLAAKQEAVLLGRIHLLIHDIGDPHTVFRTAHQSESLQKRIPMTEVDDLRCARFRKHLNQAPWQMKDRHAIALALNREVANGAPVDRSEPCSKVIDSNVGLKRVPFFMTTEMREKALFADLGSEAADGRFG